MVFPQKDGFKAKFKGPIGSTPVIITPTQSQTQSNSNPNDDSTGKTKLTMSFKPNNGKKTFIKPAKGFEVEKIDNQGPKVEKILGFSGNKVLSAEPTIKKGPLVIPFSGNNQGWRHKRSVTYIPNGEQARQSGEVITVQSLDNLEGRKQFGLQIMKTDEKDVSETMDEIESNSIQLAEPVEVKPQYTLDEQAAMALVRDASGENTSEPKISIIPLQPEVPKLEQDQFKEELNNAPDECTIEDYDRVPVEEFGAALLRGMGWKDGETIGSRKRKSTAKPVEVVRRPRLLGLGAKPLPEELAKDKKFKPKRY